jgi:CubicO group peptidase (beta-lactamase class C family)
MKISNHFFLLYFLVITFLSCEPSSTWQPISNQLDTYFQKEFPADQPGGAILVLKNGKVLFEKGYGLADLNTKEQITPNTSFNTGSISKTFVMNGIMILEKERKLSLDDPLEKYFPNFKNPEIGRKVKIIHLLNHSSGLIDSRKVRIDSVFYLTAKDVENFAPILANDSTAFEAGSRFAYSNPAFNALALIIEQVTGSKWQDFIIRRIFQTAGLKDSKITDGPYPQTGVSHAYVLEKGQFIEDDYGEEPTFPAAGNGGVWSSVRNLYKYEQALQKGVFLSEDIVRKTRTIYQPENWNSSIPSFIGYSWFIGNFNGEKMIYHTGDQGGFIADYVWIPSKKIFYTILCNTPKPTAKYRKYVLERTWEHRE